MNVANEKRIEAINESRDLCLKNFRYYTGGMLQSDFEEVESLINTKYDKAVALVKDYPQIYGVDIKHNRLPKVVSNIISTHQ